MPVKRSSTADLPEHDDLVSEIPMVEKMSTAERLKHAKKRRVTQLKKYAHYEKQLEKDQNKRNKKSNPKRQKKAPQNRRVEFVNNVVLLEAAARNDVQEVKNLLSSKVSPDVTNEDGLTALHQCCIDDLEDMLKVLLSHGADVNAHDSEMWTPLHAAATCGHIHLCKILIDHGAELLAVNADGNMPYDICEDELTLDFIENEMAKRGVTQEQIDETRLSTEVKMLRDLKELAAKKGDLEFRGKVMETPLHIAAANGYLQVAEFLMKNNVSINVEDEDSWQPIHAAACWGHLPVLEILVQYGADLDARTKNGETPWDICEDIEMRERLMELKSEIAAKGQVKSRNLVRRRSTNTRSSIVSNSTGSIYSSNTSLAEKGHHSASVRRVSSKEKGAISFKEAMEEGRRLRESVSDNDDDEIPPAVDKTKNEENKINHKSDSPRKVEEVDIFMEMNDKSPKSSPRGEQLKENHDIIAPPPEGWGDIKDNKPPSSVPQPPTSSSVVKKSSPREQETKPVKPERNSKASKSKESGKKERVSSVEKKDKVIDVKKPAVQASVEKNNDLTKKSQKKTAPKPPAPQKKEQENNATESAQPNTASNASSEKGVVMRPVSERSDHHVVNQDRQAPGGPPLGTLSDLKKQRASKLQEKLQESLRFKDGEGVKSEIKNFNDNYPESDQQGVGYTNGQNGQVQTERSSNNNSYGYVEAGSGDTIRKYHFSDTTSVLGEDERQTNCCVIL